MTLIQFLERVSQKIMETPMPDQIDAQTGVVLRSHRAIVISHLNVCIQIAKHKGTKFWNPPSKHFKGPWDHIVPIVLKHDPHFFDEFKDEAQARAELKEILGI